MMHNRRNSAKPLLAGSLFLAAPAFGAVNSDAISLETIVVTASKREEQVSDVPMSITALSGGDLQRAAEVQLADFAAKVPGLSLQQNNVGQTRVILRGMNVGSVGATVATVVDDVPFSMSGAQSPGNYFSADVDTFDLSRVEVLRGPQGTLYGATAEGGIVKFVTNPPDPTEFAAQAVLGASKIDDGQTEGVVKGMINLPFWDNKAALRLTGTKQRLPGYIDNPARGTTDINHGDKYSVRGSLLMRPIDELTARFTIFDQEVAARDGNQIDVVGAAADPANPPANKFRRIDGYSTNAAFPHESTVRMRYYALSLEYDFQAATLTNATSYGTIDNFLTADFTDTNLIPGVTYGQYLGVAAYGQPIVLAERQTTYVHKFNEELRLTSNPGTTIFGHDFDWQGGVFFTRESTILDQPLDARDPTTLEVLQPPAGGANVPADYKEKAGFVDVTYHFNSAFDLGAGVRYSHTDQESQATVQCCVLYGPSMTFPKQETSEHSTTWQVAPRWHINEDNLLYARYSTGYRPGGPNLPTPALPNPPSFEPDSTRNYEIGFKSQMLEHRLSLDLAVFNIDWTDVQITTLINTPQGPRGINGNSGSARIQGVEWDITWRPLDGMTLQAMGSWIDAKITEDALGLGAQDGDELPYVPDTTVTFNADYNWHLVQSFDASVGASWSYVGTAYTGFSTSAAVEPHVTLPSYDTLKVYLGVQNDRFSANLYATNVGNSHGILDYANTGGANQTGLATFVTPRTVGMEFGVKF